MLARSFPEESKHTWYAAPKDRASAERATSQTLRVRSLLPLTSRVSSRNATAQTLPRWPLRHICSPPVITSQTRTVPSKPPVATLCPFGLKAAVKTSPPCPERTCRTSPVAASQSETVFPSVLATVAPSGLNVAPCTPLGS